MERMLGNVVLPFLQSGTLGESCGISGVVGWGVLVPLGAVLGTSWDLLGPS